MWCEIVVQCETSEKNSASTSLSNSSVIVPSLDAAGGHADSPSPSITPADDASIRSTNDEEKSKVEYDEAMKREVEETDEMIDSIVDESSFPTQVQGSFTPSNSSHDDLEVDFGSVTDSTDFDSDEDEEEEVNYGVVSEEDSEDEGGEDFVVLSDEDHH